MDTRHQQGHIYERFGAFHVRYYKTELVDGKLARVQKSKRLCAKDDRRYKSSTCKAVKDARADFMKANVNGARPVSPSISVADFWINQYLPYCEDRTKHGKMKPSTLRGYRQIWKQHLSAHFAQLTLQEYEGKLGQRFLKSLTGTQGRNTLKHIKALGSSIFVEAIETEITAAEPSRLVQSPS
jgi:hypothetical protein